MQRGISPPSDEAGPIPGTSAAGMAAQGLMGHEHEHDLDDAANDGRKAKRELSQSKRAAQNRAAQVSRNPTRSPSSSSHDFCHHLDLIGDMPRKLACLFVSEYPH